MATSILNVALPIMSLITFLRRQADFAEFCRFGGNPVGRTCEMVAAEFSALFEELRIVTRD